MREFCPLDMPVFMYGHAADPALEPNTQVNEWTGAVQKSLGEVTFLAMLRTSAAVRSACCQSWLTGGNDVFVAELEPYTGRMISELLTDFSSSSR